ncbi:hypothetical protein MRX96_022743 [Rhipicephalus microplus]
MVEQPSAEKYFCHAKDRSRQTRRQDAVLARYPQRDKTRFSAGPSWKRLTEGRANARGNSDTGAERCFEVTTDEEVSSVRRNRHDKRRRASQFPRRRDKARVRERRRLAAPKTLSRPQKGWKRVPYFLFLL